MRFRIDVILRSLAMTAALSAVMTIGLPIPRVYAQDDEVQDEAPAIEQAKPAKAPHTAATAQTSGSVAQPAKAQEVAPVATEAAPAAPEAPAPGSAAGATSPNLQKRTNELRAMLSEGKYQDVIDQADAELQKHDLPALRLYKSLAERRLKKTTGIAGQTSGTAKVDPWTERLRALRPEPTKIDDSPIVPDSVLTNPPLPVELPAVKHKGLFQQIISYVKEYQMLALYTLGGLVALVLLVLGFSAMRSRRAARQEATAAESETMETGAGEIGASDVVVAGGMPEDELTIPGEAEEENAPFYPQQAEEAPSVSPVEAAPEPAPAPEMEVPLSVDDLLFDEPETLGTPEKVDESVPPPRPAEPQLDLTFDFLDTTAETSKAPANDDEARTQTSPGEQQATQEQEEIDFEDIGVGQAKPSSPQSEKVEDLFPEEDETLGTYSGSQQSAEKKAEVAPMQQKPAQAGAASADFSRSPFDDLGMEDTLASAQPFETAAEDMVNLDEQMDETLPTEQENPNVSLAMGADKSALTTEENSMLSEQISRGDDAAARGDWKTAIHYYNVASAIDPDSITVSEKLEEAKRHRD